MSKRHEQQAKKRASGNYGSAATRFYVQEWRPSGSTVTLWIVRDREEHRVVAGPMERGDRARATARRLNEEAGLGSRATVYPAQSMLVPPQPGEPLGPFVEAVLERAIFYDPRRMPPAFIVENTDQGSVVVRQIPWSVRHTGQAPLQYASAEEEDRAERRRWHAALARYGLGVVEDEDRDGHFLRVTSRILGRSGGVRR